MCQCVRRYRIILFLSLFPMILSFLFHRAYQSPIYSFPLRLPQIILFYTTHSQVQSYFCAAEQDQYFPLICANNVPCNGLVKKSPSMGQGQNATLTSPFLNFSVRKKYHTSKCWVFRLLEVLPFWQVELCICFPGEFLWQVSALLEIIGNVLSTVPEPLSHQYPPLLPCKAFLCYFWLDDAEQVAPSASVIKIPRSFLMELSIAYELSTHAGSPSSMVNVSLQLPCRYCMTLASFL